MKKQSIGRFRTDVKLNLTVWGNVILSANVNNVFDVIPQWKFESVSPAGAALLADPAMVKVQSNLVTFNQRYAIMTYDGYHFSQLGRLFNFVVTYQL